MTSKEALELIVMPDKEYEKKIAELGIDRYEPYEVIKKDLEILDILKKNASVNLLNGYQFMVDIPPEHYEKVKEWLENGK